MKLFLTNQLTGKFNENKFNSNLKTICTFKPREKRYIGAHKKVKRNIHRNTVI